MYIRLLHLTLFLLLLQPAQLASAQVSTCERSQGEAFLTFNNVRARLLNTGGLFYRGEPHVYNVPKYTGGNAIFATTILVMGKVDGELRGSGSRYGEWEFWAGPLDENGNPPADCAVYDRIHIVDIEDITEYDATGTASPELSDWPWELGAPVVDGDGNPDNYNLAGGDRPEIIGHQTAWWVMNDRGNVHESTDLPPLGIEVQVTAFAALGEQVAVRNATLYKYKIINKSGSPIEDTFFGIFSDPDLGDFADDYIGSDSVLNLGYVYNSDNQDTGNEGYGTPPPSTGYDIIQGPLVDNDGMDNNNDGVVDEPNERAGLYAFVYYNGGGGISGEPSLGNDYYMYMQGQWKNGQPILLGGDGYVGSTTNIPTRYMFSGDPVSNEGWSERNPGIDGSLPPNIPADRRFIMSSGPFSIGDGKTQEIVFSIVWALGEDNWDSVNAMKEASEVVEEAYLNGFDIPLAESTLREAPLQLSPANFAQSQPVNPIVRWRGDSLMLGFQLQLASSPSFEDIEQDFQVVTDELALSDLSPFTTYHWRIRGVNDLGNGPWSQAWQFTTSDQQLPRLLSPISGFMAVSNADGLIQPPDMAAFAFNNSGFPVLEGNLTPEGSYPDSDRPTQEVQQSTNASVWGIHAGGAAIDFGELPLNCGDICPKTFLSQAVPEGWGTIGVDDYEWRFTETCFDAIDGTIEAGDCLARRLFDDETDMEVPFELWNIGDPGTAEDDYRMIPVVCEEACEAGTEPGIFDLNGDHPISGGQNDPFTDFVFWYKPKDNGASPGEQGYTNYFFGDGELGELTFSRLVLVQWNGGETPLYTADLPEAGSIFRIVLDPFPTPIPSAPNDGAFTSIFGTELFWTSAFDGYQIQIDTSPTFAAPIVDTTGTANLGFAFEEPVANQTYFWRVRAAARPGAIFSEWSEIRQFTPIVSGVTTEPELPLPESLTVDGNYPNPFQLNTTIRYALPEPLPVRIDVFDVLGRRVATVLDETQNAGWHEAIFSADALPAGLYIYRISAGPFSDTNTMIHIH